METCFLNSVPHSVWGFGYLMRLLTLVWNGLAAWGPAAELPLLGGAGGLITVNRRSAAPGGSPALMNLCARPSSAAVFMRRRRHDGCIWEDVCHWMSSFFSFAEHICWTNGNAPMMSAFLCWSCPPFRPHPPACALSFRRCPVCVCVRKHVITRDDVITGSSLENLLFVMSLLHLKVQLAVRVGG